MRVQSRGLYDDEEDDSEALAGIRRQEPFSLQEENKISTEITPQEIPDIRRLGALSAIQNVPGVSNAESAEIESSPTAPPAEVNMPESTSLPPEESVEEPGFFARLGQALSNFIQPIPLGAISSQDDGRGLEQESQRVFPRDIQYVTDENYDPSQYMHAGMRRLYESTPETDFYRNSPAAMQFANPEIRAQIERENKLAINNFKAKHAEMQATGNPDIIDGEIEALDADPSAQAEFKEVTGRDYTEKLSEELKNYVKATTNATESLNAEAQAIRDRIAGGAETMTNKDKLMLGLAVIIPVLLAGAFGGKEGAIGALSGGLEGLGKALTKEKDLDSGAALKRLSEIEKDKLAIEKQGLEQFEKAEKNLVKESEIKGTNKKFIPELEGFEVKEIKDKQTGKEKIGVRLGSDELLYDTKKLRKGNATADIKRMNEMEDDAIYRTQNLKELDNAIDQLDNIYKQIEEQGYKGYVQAGLGSLFEGGENLDAIMVKDPLTGETVNASAAAKSIREVGLDNYRRAMGGKQALTGRIEGHFQGILPNPFDFDNKLSVEEARKLGEQYRANARKKFVDNLVAEGFLREPLEDTYLSPLHEKRIEGQKKERQDKQTSHVIKAIRENPKLKKREVVEIDTNG